MHDPDCSEDALQQAGCSARAGDIRQNCRQPYRIEATETRSNWFARSDLC